MFGELGKACPGRAGWNNCSLTPKNSVPERGGAGFVCSGKEAQTSTAHPKTKTGNVLAAFTIFSSTHWLQKLKVGLWFGRMVSEMLSQTEVAVHDRQDPTCAGDPFLAQTGISNWHLHRKVVMEKSSISGDSEKDEEYFSWIMKEKRLTRGFCLPWKTLPFPLINQLIEANNENSQHLCIAYYATHCDKCFTFTRVLQNAHGAMELQNKFIFI